MIDLKENEVDPEEEVRQVQAEKKTQLLGTITPHPGHILFEVNLKEHTIEPATFEEQTASYAKEVDKKGRPVNKPKSKGLGVMEYSDGTKKLVIDKVQTISKVLIRKPNCTYIPALNRNNVIKKLVKKGLIKIVRKDGK